MPSSTHNADYDEVHAEAMHDYYDNPPEPDHDYDPIAERLDFEQAMRDLGYAVDA